MSNIIDLTTKLVEKQNQEAKVFFVESWEILDRFQGDFIQQNLESEDETN